MANSNVELQDDIDISTILHFQLGEIQIPNSRSSPSSRASSAATAGSPPPTPLPSTSSSPPPTCLGNWTKVEGDPLQSNSIVSFSTGVTTILVIFLSYFFSLLTMVTYGFHHHMVYNFLFTLNIAPIIWLFNDREIRRYAKAKLRSWFVVLILEDTFSWLVLWMANRC